LYFASTFADIADHGFRPCSATTSLATLTEHGGIYDKISLTTKAGLFQSYGHSDQSILSRSGARPWTPITATAEEGIHDVAEAKTTCESFTESGTTHVVVLSLLWITQNLICSSDLFELLCDRRVRIDVRMHLTCELAIGLLDLICTRIAFDTQYLVKVHGLSPYLSEKSLNLLIHIGKCIG
jgi:hypothetical protein